ncbi:hypothetical protein A0H76_1616 [Hepatospora eriocheir]|uniref:Uncharacterized protein n=1 Tax=Hepatospora eriocheir TaxID=1081669 RepID=A0A1X0QGT2_9MICR|nr:hypothetical protein A0H76_1616 [Hepatospora eriocheir]
MTNEHKSVLKDVKNINKPVSKPVIITNNFEDDSIKDNFNDLEYSYENKEVESRNNEYFLKDVKDLEYLYSKIDEYNLKEDKNLVSNNLVSNNSLLNSKDNQIELEFNILKNTHEKTLSTKGKIYRFIYDEIYKIEQKYINQISELEGKMNILSKENEQLRIDLKKLEIECSDIKNNIKNRESKEFQTYKLQINEYVKSWKESAKQAMLEYVNKRKRF